MNRQSGEVGHSDLAPPDRADPALQHALVVLRDRLDRRRQDHLVRHDDRHLPDHHHLDLFVHHLYHLVRDLSAAGSIP